MPEAIKPANFQPIERRCDPLDRQVGQHIPEQGEIEVLHSPEAGLVLKSAPADKLAAFQNDAALSRIAAGAGLKVATMHTAPYLEAGRVKCLIEYVDHQPDRSIDPRLAAQTAAKLHSIRLPDGYPSAISPLGRIANEVMNHPACEPELARLIAARCLPLVAKITADMNRHQTLVHGDLHLGNILPTNPLPTLIDFEHGGRGSPLWDIANTNHAANRFGLNQSWAQQFIDTWAQEANRPLDLLQDYTDWRSWYGALSLWQRVQRGSAGRIESNELAVRLGWVYDPNNGDRWQRV